MIGGVSAVSNEGGARRGRRGRRDNRHALTGQWTLRASVTPHMPVSLARGNGHSSLVVRKRGRILQDYSNREVRK
jgi:hypothetical protein